MHVTEELFLFSILTMRYHGALGISQGLGSGGGPSRDIPVDGKKLVIRRPNSSKKTKLGEGPDSAPPPNWVGMGEGPGHLD